MEIQAAINYLTEFRKTTNSAKNSKYTEKFIRLLNEIQIKEIDSKKRSLLNSELNLIIQNFEIDKNNIQVKKELKKFIQFLKSEFDVTIQWYYTQIGALGGLVATVFFGFLSLLLGLLIGAAIGYYFDEKARKDGRKLKTDLNEFIC